MVEAQNFANILLVFLWFFFLIYILINRKVIAINTLGFLVALSLVYPYILYHDILNNIHQRPDFKYEVLLCRYLMLITFFSFVSKSKTLNNQLIKLSQNEKNLLKPKNDK